MVAEAAMVFLRGTVAMETGPSQCCVTAAVPQTGEVGVKLWAGDLQGRGRKEDGGGRDGESEREIE